MVGDEPPAPNIPNQSIFDCKLFFLEFSDFSRNFSTSVLYFLEFRLHTVDYGLGNCLRNPAYPVTDCRMISSFPFTFAILQSVNFG